MNDILILKTIKEDKLNVYFYFNNNDNIVCINRYNLKIKCTCFHGSNFGINNKQLCKHKRFILNKFNDGKILRNG